MGLWDMTHTVESLHVKSSMPNTHNIIGLKLAIVAMGAKKSRTQKCQWVQRTGKGREKKLWVALCLEERPANVFLTQGGVLFSLTGQGGTWEPNLGALAPPSALKILKLSPDSTGLFLSASLGPTGLSWISSQEALKNFSRGTLSPLCLLHGYFLGQGDNPIQLLPSTPA